VKAAPPEPAADWTFAIRPWQSIIDPGAHLGLEVLAAQGLGAAVAVDPLQEPRGVAGRRLQLLPGQENDRRLQRRQAQGDQRRGDEGKLDGGGSGRVTLKPALRRAVPDGLRRVLASDLGHDRAVVGAGWPARNRSCTRAQQSPERPNRLQNEN
jgi:hypothetical protein